MLKIRLARVGKKKQPTYRVVIADARAPRDGAYVEIIGHYNPRTDPTTFEVDAEKVSDWLRKGAQPTERVEKLLNKRGIGRATAGSAGAVATAVASPGIEAAREAPEARPEPEEPVAAQPPRREEPVPGEAQADPTGPSPLDPGGKL